MKRFVSLFLSTVLLFALLVPAVPTAHAAESNEYEAGYLSVITGYVPDKVVWDAVVVHKGTPNFEILMNIQDIADIAGVKMLQELGGYTLQRDAYEVRVNMNTHSAQAYLVVSTGEQFPLYNGTFALDNAIMIDGTPWLPLEKVLYMLHASWYPSGGIVYVNSPKETLFTLMGEYYAMCTSTPSFTEIAGESESERYGAALKYCMLALADELDFRVFHSGLFITDENTNAFLQTLSLPSADARSEAQIALEDYVTPAYEIVKTATDIDKDNFDSQITGGVITAITGRTTPKIDLSPYLTVTDSFINTFKAIDVAHRSTTWTETFLARMKYFSEISANGSDTRKYVANAAKSLYSENNNIFGNAVWENGKWAMKAALDAVLSKSAFSYYIAFKKVYDLSVAYMKLASPKFRDALQTGDNMYMARCHYNIATVARQEYMTQYGNFLDGDISANCLQNIYLSGLSMVSSSAHGWNNIYLVRKSEGKQDNALTAQMYLESNTDYILRFELCEPYNDQLVINTSYTGMHTSLSEDKVPRGQIPEDYVRENAEIFVTNRKHTLKDGFIHAAPHKTEVPEGFTPIYTFDELMALCTGKTHTGSYILMNDIVCGDYTSDFVINRREGSKFEGTIDGNGYTISNIHTPIFGEIHNATITNLGLEVSGTYTNEWYGMFGALAFYAQSVTLNNCFVTGSIHVVKEKETTTASTIGGFFAHHDGGGYFHCYSGLNITAASPADGDYMGAIIGGFVGDGNCGFVNCFNQGNISIPQTTAAVYIGGLAGSILLSEEINQYCYNTGSLTATTKTGKIGGLFGDCVTPYAYTQSLDHCWNSGYILAKGTGDTPTVSDIKPGNSFNFDAFTVYAGGLVGEGRSMSISNCHNAGPVIGRDISGGIIGQAVDVILTDSYNTGEVDGAVFIGGICAMGAWDLQLTRCVNSGKITKTEASGNIVSILHGEEQYGYVPTIENCYYTDDGKSPAVGGYFTTTGPFTPGGKHPNIVCITEAEAAQQDTYKEFDFRKVWSFDPESEDPLSLRF